jgi:hypothetical protein
MARQSTEAALRAQKDAKQKKVLFLLVPVFLILVVWQGPKTLKAFTGGSSATPPPVAATTATTPSPAPGSPAPGSPAPSGGGSLPDTDVKPAPLDGQLVSFSRFRGRDPFALTAPPSDSSDSATPADSDATIEVNGTSEDLSIDDTFPAGDPTFTLVDVSAQSASIGLVSGTFSNGDETIAINVGETLVLVADDGARYAIKLVSVAGG